MELSKAQIDRLGDRLKTGRYSKSDLEALSKYRVSHRDAYNKVVATLRQKFDLLPTGRPAKSTSSLVDKLHRETIRLSQVQDIAGCRIIVTDITEQERLIPLICNAFTRATVFDRRVKPSHGYRAVHVVVNVFGKLIEIQLRTEVQHLWAELSEKLSDHEPEIKYGGGDAVFRTFLDSYSKMIFDTEDNEVKILNAKKSANDKDLLDIENRMIFLKKQVIDSLNKALVYFKRSTNK